MLKIDFILRNYLRITKQYSTFRHWEVVKILYYFIGQTRRILMILSSYVKQDRVENVCDVENVMMKPIIHPGKKCMLFVKTEWISALDCWPSVES